MWSKNEKIDSLKAELIEKNDTVLELMKDVSAFKALYESAKRNNVHTTETLKQMMEVRRELERQNAYLLNEVRALYQKDQRWFDESSMHRFTVNFELFNFSELDIKKIVSEYNKKSNEPWVQYPEGTVLYDKYAGGVLGELIYSYGTRCPVGRRVVNRVTNGPMGGLTWDDIARYTQPPTHSHKFKVGDTVYNPNWTSLEYIVAEVKPCIYTLVREGQGVIYRHRDEVEREFRLVHECRL